MKFGEGFQRVQSPSGQSVASGPVARLAATAATTGLMRSQANKWAVGLQPRNHRHSGAQGFTAPEGSTCVSDLASEQGTGGVEGHGTLEEETPATWETPVLPVGDPGHEGPVTSPRTRRTYVDAGTAGAQDGTQNKHRPTGRYFEGKPEGCRNVRGVGWQHSSDEVGKRLAPGAGGAKAKPVPRKNFRRET